MQNSKLPTAGGALKAFLRLLVFNTSAKKRGRCGFREVRWV